MDAASFHSQLDFYMPDCDVCNTQTLSFPPDLLKIFYIARVIFSESSTHRIKTQSAPLFSREIIFSSGTGKTDSEAVQHTKAKMENHVNLDRITSIGDIAHLLPREHMIYDENIFYKKLANRELIKIDYEAPTGAVTSVDNFLKRDETLLKRSQKVYLLFDNSTSMNGEKFKKLFASKAIAVEYLRRVSREMPEIYFRSFHSDIGELVKASTREEIQNLIQHITDLKTGGGRITNIGKAIEQAIEDINSDPELKEAEILIMTDGFGPMPKDINQRLGAIKLHVILIPDLDIEKILNLYPDRPSWETGGPDGSRPMPSFWRYYTTKPPPMILDGDELYQDKALSYKTASKSVKDLKVLEILQGLHQIYTLQEVCENFIFVVITSLLGDTFTFSLKDLEPVEASINELMNKPLAGMNNDEKLSFLQTVNFMVQFLTIAKSNTKDKAVKKKIKALMKQLEALQARILADPWIRSMLKVDKIKFDVKFDMAAAKKNDEMPLFSAFAFLVRFVWEKISQSLKLIIKDYRFS